MKWMILALAALSFSAGATCYRTDCERDPYQPQQDQYQRQQRMLDSYRNQVGSTVYEESRDNQGNRWHGTSRQIGNSTYYEGIRNDGKVYGGVCNKFGCN